MSATETTAAADPREPSPWTGTAAIASTGTSVGSVMLVEGQTFCLSGRTGDMSPAVPQGLFVLDTRVVATWQLRLDGRPLEPLTVTIDQPFSATFALRGQPAEGQADACIVCLRRRDVGNGLRERITVTNHGLEERSLELQLVHGTDFADVFAVKESRAHAGGRQRSEVVEGAVLHVQADAGAERVVEVRVHGAELDAETATWQVALAPGASFETCVEVRVRVAEQELEPRFECGRRDGQPSVPERRLHEWRSRLPRVVSDHRPLEESVAQAGLDLGALRIFDPEHPEVPILAAGAPWFMTVFGRDSLLTAWMTLLADPSLALGVLTTLARFQGEDVDLATEEEPGKILHEIRFNAATQLTLRGGDRYYGSVDATPLFVMLLGEVHRWGGDVQEVRRLLPHADRALDWIERFGDVDGDGYVEYEQRSPRGLANQGWKDSWDALRHPDGSLARGPIALCEVQGYVWAAYTARALLAEAFDDPATAARCRERAAALRRRFDDDFWMEDAGCYALALDGDKRTVAAVASNSGHCLWAGIAEPHRAPALARTLTSPQMFSGWGVRTLSTDMRAYNPVSYHNGSVWPHDNAMCIDGLRRHGCDAEAHAVLRAQLEVAQASQWRLPELFAGFSRDEVSAPASYPASCSPQAWAAAAPLLWVRALLGLRPDAPSRRLHLDPSLPPWMRHLRVEGLRIAGHDVSVEVEGDEVEVVAPPGFTVEQRAEHQG